MMNTHTNPVTEGFTTHETTKWVLSINNDYYRYRAKMKFLCDPAPITAERVSEWAITSAFTGRLMMNVTKIKWDEVALVWELEQQSLQAYLAYRAQQG